MALINGSGSALERTLRLAALLGVIRLPKLFLVLVVKRERVGSIGGRWIYGVGEWKLKAVSHRSFDGTTSAARKLAALTARYKAMVLADMDLRQDFYFSYFYDLTHTMQHNLLAWKKSKEEFEAVQREKAAAAAAQAAATAAAAEEAASAAAAASAEAAEEEQDPSLFDPIANEQPHSRRRSVTHHGGVPPGPSPPLVPSMQPLAEADEDEEDDDGEEREELRPLERSDSADGGDADEEQPIPAAAREPPKVVQVAAAAAVPASLPSNAAPSKTAAATSPQPQPQPPPSKQQQPWPSQQPSEFYFNRHHASADPALACYNEKWLWNLHLAREFLHEIPHGSYWLVPLIHGFFQQRTVRIGGRKDVLVTLLARRSRHFAGTRFIKRGVSSLGHVANEVESEQIVAERHAFAQGMAAFSSVVMLRGSIPLYWAQESVKSMRPEIVVYNFDRDLVATHLHIRSLFARYGAPIAFLSLIKQEEKTPQETRLGQAFGHAIQRVQAQFRMDRVQRDLAASSCKAKEAAAAAVAASERGGGGRRFQQQQQLTSSSSPGHNRSSTFARDLAQREQLERVHADLARAGTSSFPTGALLASTAQTTDASFSRFRPPYVHPAYDAQSILYCTYDFLAMRARQANVLKDLRNIVSNLVEEIGVFTFVARPPPPAQPKQQQQLRQQSALLSTALAASSVPVSSIDAAAVVSAAANNTTPLQQAFEEQRERNVVSVQKGIIRTSQFLCQFTLGRRARHVYELSRSLLCCFLVLPLSFSRLHRLSRSHQRGHLLRGQSGHEAAVAHPWHLGWRGQPA
jgi:hypothetical protein